MKAKSKITQLKRTVAASAAVASVATVHSQTIDYDGIFSGADGYSNTEIVTWFNGHDDTTYGDFDSQFFNTVIRYGVGTIAGDSSGTEYFFLFAESPLEAKNMVWGDGMTNVEVSQYGSRLDFSKATGSEKIGLRGPNGEKLLEVDIGSSGDGGGKKDKKDKKDKDGKDDSDFGFLSFKDSVDYLLGNGISTEDSSSASNVTMSVEMQFALDPVKNAAVVAAARNGLDFHLSPDRGLIPALVPEPSSTLLFGLVAVIGLFRRKR